MRKKRRSWWDKYDSSVPLSIGILLPDGVCMPIITKSFSINDREEIVAQKRNTYKECIDFLVGELDQAAKELPANWNGDDYGRATSVAALALKSRILLYAASPLMNEDVKIPEVGYTTPTRQMAKSCQGCNRSTGCSTGRWI